MPPKGALAPSPAKANANIKPKDDNAKADSEKKTAAQQKGRKRKSTDEPSAPTAKKAKSTTATTIKEAKKDSKADTKKSAKDSKKDNGLIDVSDIHLPGEESESVPIYETAANMRRRLTTFLTHSKTTNKAFAEAIAAASNTRVSADQLSRFRKKGTKGGGSSAVDGADSPVFYAAWVYFEKVRVKEGGKKSKHREEMESAWGAKGMDRSGLKPLLLHSSERASYDKLGRLLINGKVRQ